MKNCNMSEVQDKNISNELFNAISKVCLLALDVDGVLTDGSIYYTSNNECFRRFNVYDGQGLQFLMKAGIEVAIFSAKLCPSISNRMQDLGIKNIYIGSEDKFRDLNTLCQTLSLELSQVAYIGDDINDLPIMHKVGCPLTVSNAMVENLVLALYVTEQSGGNGAVREICDLMLHIRKPFRLIS